MCILPIVKQAVSHGDRIAICMGTDPASLQTSYSELVEAALQVALYLLHQQENRRDLQEDRVAFLVPPGPEYVAAQWGVWMAGGIAVPLSLSATESEIEYVLTDSQTRVVISVREYANKNIATVCQKLGLQLIFLEDTQSSVKDKLLLDSLSNLPNIHTDRRAMILYTSGTTSRPKGVVSTHACIQAQIETLVDAWRWSPDDCIPLFLPLHHIHGIINCLSCALWVGAKIETFSRFDTTVIMQRVKNHAFTVFMAVPTIYVMLIDSLKSLNEPERMAIIEGFRSMRLMVSGSAALPASVHNCWTELTGQKLLERYGMTEIGMALSNPYEGERRPGAVGMPLPNVQVRVQTENGDIVRNDHIPGEIQVRGPNVFLEYWQRPEITQSSFTDGWFKTGDIAIIENGYYRILGRQSIDIIKSGGYKLSALEIESVLLDHPDISQCAVVGIPDTKFGECVAAAVILDPRSPSMTLESLKNWCKERMSHYKIPRKLILLDKLPRNAMGKVTKPEVQKLFE
jgi:malonyl-CoA/methylmalonyl-CoA synthetase